jgi:hypothetical protein
MTAIRVIRRPTGPRVYLLGCIRLHHGLTGLATAAAGAVKRRPWLLVAGAVACWHDRRDFPWIADC